MLVTVNHSGVCSGHAFTKGVPVELPSTVLAALGEGSYEVVGSQQEKQQSPAEDKMVKKPKQK